MNTIRINTENVIGKIKPMHAVNNGPVVAGQDQLRSNYNAFCRAGIPFVRNHDASFTQCYGSEHTVDIQAVFPDFDKDPKDPASYDFPITDKYIGDIVSTGAEVFYRLGSRIEHDIKKYGTLPPKDNKKWAVICEHIIRHYNEGWANGYHYGIRYWEIWNEPELDPEDSTNKRTWGGTFEEFLKLFEVAAKHLKSCFPDLMIGGPAFANVWKANKDGTKLDIFLKYMKEHGVELDFFSWHIYGRKTKYFKMCADAVSEMLKKYGYVNTQNILNEWNYIEDWEGKFVHSIETFISMKGAAFNSAVMTVCQNCDIDMLMYYDARPCVFNGLFDYYTLRPLKGYYSYLIFNDLYRKGQWLESQCDDPDLYVTAAKDDNGDISAFISYFSEDDDKEDKEITVELGGYRSKPLNVYLLDEDNTLEKIGQTADGKITLTMKLNTVIKISETNGLEQ